MRTDKKKSALIDTKKLTDLYSAQFEYSDLVTRLSKLKKTREIARRGVFKSFDLSMTTKNPYCDANNNKRRSVSKPKKKTRVKSAVCDEFEANIGKQVHHRSISDKFYQSELIPLYTPGFSVYYKHNVSAGRRLNK